MGGIVIAAEGASVKQDVGGARAVTAAGIRLAVIVMRMSAARLDDDAGTVAWASPRVRAEGLIAPQGA